MKVWDVDNNVIDEPGAIINDLNRARTYETMPADIQYLLVATPATQGMRRVGLLNPDVLRRKLEVVKFPDITISKTGLTAAVGIAPYTVDVKGVKAGDWLVSGVVSTTAGFAPFNPYSTQDDKVTVLIYGPMLTLGSFSVTMRLMALR